MKKILLFFLLFPFALIGQERESKLYKSVSFEELQTILQQKNDTTYIVNFWATWCAPCIKELPAFEKISKEYKDQAVQVILVSLDFKRNIDSKLLPFLEKHNLDPKVLFLDNQNPNSWIDKVNSNWTGAIPATLIYQRLNSEFFEKSFTYVELKEELDKIRNQ
ncbi:MAG: TlpA disulfide reductase family protein [Bacteroidales bacterium]